MSAPKDDALARAVAEHGPFPLPTGCPSPGELAEQRHLLDPLDVQLSHLADVAPVTTCRCDEPSADPYECEASDCAYPFSELNPFGTGGRPVNEPSAEVSRTCSTCGWRTSVWHVDDGSADQELYEHAAQVHPAKDDRRAATGVPRG